MKPDLAAPMFVTVLRPAEDCTANGLSGPARCPKGYAWLLPSGFVGDAPKGVVLRLKRGPTGLPIAVPDDVNEGAGKCRMFGGNFLHTSDGRWPFPGPIAVHDRFDSWEAYNANCD